MTNAAFLNNFYNQLNKVRTFQGPGYGPTEISLFATEAQELLIVTKYTPVSNQLKEGFEETEKRIQDLGNLVRDAVIAPLSLSSSNMQNGRFFQLPNTLLIDPVDYSNVFWFTVFEEGITNLTDCNGAFIRVPIYEINHNEFDKLRRDPFNKPSQTRAWRLRIEQNRHELITDGTYNITDYHVRYIKKPLPIDLTSLATDSVSELSDEMHRELVRKTVELVLDDTENRIRIAIEQAKRKE